MRSGEGDVGPAPDAPSKGSDTKADGPSDIVRGAEPRARPAEPSGPVCDLCGAPMRESHCKLICDQCGYVRDCSDP